MILFAAPFPGAALLPAGTPSEPKCINAPTKFPKRQ